MTGRELQIRLLNQYHIQVEMAAESYVLGIITMCDTKEGFERLADALSEIDKNLAESLETVKIPVFCKSGQEDMVYSLSEMRDMEKEEIPLISSKGRVSADYVNLYPPGIPILLPGECISNEHIMLIEGYLRKKLHVQGLFDEKILVLKE